MAFGKGERRGGRYFHGSRKFGITSAKKLARKVSSDTVPYSDTARRYFVLRLTWSVIINCVGYVDFSSSFELHNEVTVAMDGV